MKTRRERLDFLTPRWMQICRALTDCDLNMAWAARVAGIKRATMQDYCKRIAIATGLSPTNFYDLQELLEMEVKDVCLRSLT